MSLTNYKLHSLKDKINEEADRNLKKLSEEKSESSEEKGRKKPNKTNE